MRTILLISVVFLVCTSEKPLSTREPTMQEALKELHYWESKDLANREKMLIINNQ